MVELPRVHRLLAAELSNRRVAGNATVLALPRGGVPVGFAVAHELHLPLDVIVARKVGVPWQPEFARKNIPGPDWPSSCPYRSMKRTVLVLILVPIALLVAFGVARSRAARTEPVILPKIVSLTATPRMIKRGESVTVAWEARGTQSMAMEWGPTLHPDVARKRRTGLPSSGTMIDQPEETTIYVLECEDALGYVCTSASTTVMVK